MRLLPPSPVCDDAEFSPDGCERLWLSRKVAEMGPVGLVIGLNPSTAGATIASNDPTIKKMTVFARNWGWSGFWMTNVFTCIETYSAKLRTLQFEAAVGACGTQVLEAAIPLAPEIVVCWGAAVPKHMIHRISSVCVRIRHLKKHDARVLCFGTSKGGHPVHPLYLSYDTPLVDFDLPIERTSRR